MQTAFPILGANPPKAAARPALRPDVACETQTPPSLKTIVGAPPTQVQTNSSSPAAQALNATARAGAIKWLRNQIRQANFNLRSQGKPPLNLKVSNSDITPAQIQQIAAATGHTGQLDQVASLLRRAPAGGKR